MKINKETCKIAEEEKKQILHLVDEARAEVTSWELWNKTNELIELLRWKLTKQLNGFSWIDVEWAIHFALSKFLNILPETKFEASWQIYEFVRKTARRKCLDLLDSEKNRAKKAHHLANFWYGDSLQNQQDASEIFDQREKEEYFRSFLQKYIWMFINIKNKQHTYYPHAQRILKKSWLPNDKWEIDMSDEKNYQAKQIFFNFVNQKATREEKVKLREFFEIVD